MKRSIQKKLDVVKNERNTDTPYLETEEEAAEYIADINEGRKNKKDHTDKEDDTDSEYDCYGFNKYGIHKDTNEFYDSNNFYINGKNRFTNNKYDINGFDLNGIHKDTMINFNENINKKELLRNTLWLKNRYNFLKSYIKLLEDENITETVNNKIILLKTFKDFMNAIVNRLINNNNIKEINNKIFSNIEKDLDNSKSSKNVDKLKNYLIKIKNLVNKYEKKN